jgi:hypothetical protein
MADEEFHDALEQPPDATPKPAPEPSRKRKRPSFLSLKDQTIVTLKVGPDAQPLNIHKDLICKSSKYFTKAFNGGFKEAEERSITLKDVDVVTAQRYMHWLYTNSLEEEEEGDYMALDSLQPLDLAQLYVFGDRFDAPDLRNRVMQILEYCRNGSVDAKVVIYAYDNLLDTAPLCRWLVRHCAHYWDPENTPEDPLQDELPHAFLLQVAIMCRKRLTLLRKKGTVRDRAGGQYRHKEYCQYHDHEDHETAAACRKECDGLHKKWIEKQNYKKTKARKNGTV